MHLIRYYGPVRVVLILQWEVLHSQSHWSSDPVAPSLFSPCILRPHPYKDVFLPALPMQFDFVSVGLQGSDLTQLIFCLPCATSCMIGLSLASQDCELLCLKKNKWYFSLWRQFPLVGCSVNTLGLEQPICGCTDMFWGLVLSASVL